ncbi:hypothetical protein DFJ74DRAFT_411481 [Hyaloraphidium curvatum]|nr:hypothetical protein DFJ74DRAFT_411481 [Hyaloraphidium curvatum]
MSGDGGPPPASHTWPPYFPPPNGAEPPVPPPWDYGRPYYPYPQPGSRSWPGYGPPQQQPYPVPIKTEPGTGPQGDGANGSPVSKTPAVGPELATVLEQFARNDPSPSVTTIAQMAADLNEDEEVGSDFGHLRRSPRAGFCLQRDRPLFDASSARYGAATCREKRADPLFLVVGVDCVALGDDWRYLGDWPRHRHSPFLAPQKISEWFAARQRGRKEALPPTDVPLQPPRSDYAAAPASAGPPPLYQPQAPQPIGPPSSSSYPQPYPPRQPPPLQPMQQPPHALAQQPPPTQLVNPPMPPSMPPSMPPPASISAPIQRQVYSFSPYAPSAPSIPNPSQPPMALQQPLYHSQSAPLPQMTQSAPLPIQTGRPQSPAQPRGQFRSPPGPQRRSKFLRAAGVVVDLENIQFVSPLNGVLKAMRDRIWELEGENARLLAEREILGRPGGSPGGILQPVTKEEELDTPQQQPRMLPPRAAKRNAPEDEDEGEEGEDE